MTEATQRWHQGRQIFLPPGGTIASHDYEVAEIRTDNVAKRFIVAHHYSGTYPAARARYGLYRRDQLVGVAVLSVPMRREVVTPWFPCDFDEVVELGRFVLLDDVPYNGETWFFARARELLVRAGYRGVISFSDPVPRILPGSTAPLFPGHVGYVYQASNAIYAGRSKRSILRVLPDGAVLSNRALAKLRARARGWRYVAALLERHGAEPVPETGDVEPWLATWLPRLVTRVRHGGNHRYLWGLKPRLHASMRAELRPLPYPKQLDR